MGCEQPPDCAIGTIRGLFKFGNNCQKLHIKLLKLAEDRAAAGDTSIEKGFDYAQKDTASQMQVPLLAPTPVGPQQK